MEDRIYIIIAKVLDGEAGEAERRELDAWLAEDAQHREIFAEMQTTWNDTTAMLQTPQFNTAAAWEKVSARTVQAEIQVASPKRGKTIALRGWMGYSAAIAAMLVIAVLVWDPFRTGSVQIAATDADRRFELPDHSIITLRKGASFSYPKKFAAAERRVKMEGEAYFEVAHNEAQPFVIDAQPVDVRVLGTTFNVRCNKAAADVTVTTGRVQVAAQSDAAKVVKLAPGRKAHYESGQITESAATGYEAGWKSGELSFNNESLSKVVAAVAAAKDTSVQLDARIPAQQQVQAVTISFRNQSLEDMLTELCLITNCRWEKRGAAYLVLPK